MRHSEVAMANTEASGQQETPPRKPIPPGRLAVAGVLIAAAIVVPLLVDTYASEKPRLWGFPFFFWYQLLWVFIASACTYLAYLIVERGRR
jgi:hypothetical protein